MRHRFFLVLLVLVLLACSSAARLIAGDYDASCQVDTECALASFGDVCELHCNPNGAINTREQGRYEADFSEKSKECDQVDYVRDPCQGIRRPHEARCVAGRCAVIETVDRDAGADR